MKKEPTRILEMKNMIPGVWNSIGKPKSKINRAEEQINEVKELRVFCRISHKKTKVWKAWKKN